MQFVEEYGSITISQCYKMFYNNAKYGYDIARRRLNKLVAYGKLKVTRDNMLGQNVYYVNRKLSSHDLIVLDFYAELVRTGANIVLFKQRYPWMGGKLVSDAFVCYVFNGNLYFNIVEVVKTHSVDVDKYLELYKSGEAQRICCEIYKRLGGKEDYDGFPTLIIIDDIKHKNPIYINDKITVYQLNFNMQDFPKIFM